MAKQIPLPEPGENLVIWSARHGREAIELLNGLSLLNFQLVPAQGSIALAPGQKNIQGDLSGLMVSIPLKFRRPIANPGITEVDQLLEELRVVGMLPR